jgi:transcriptional regulator
LESVITGDIVNSTSIGRDILNWIMDSIGSAWHQWDKDFGIYSETFRGDGFQSFIPSVTQTLEMAFIQKLYIRSLDPYGYFTTPKKTTHLCYFDARMAIGIGEKNTIGKKISTSNGPAFELSGRALDNIKNTKYTLAIATGDTHEDELKVLISLMDAIIAKTSIKQCEVLTHKLLGYTEMEIAKLLKVEQSAVNQRSTSGNWYEIDLAVKRFKNIYSNV